MFGGNGGSPIIVKSILNLFFTLVIIPIYIFFFIIFTMLCI